MDLGNPGADLLGANEAAALRVLARRTDAVSGREVARLAGASSSSIRRALERLVGIGLVTARATRHAVLYELNASHVLWGPVRDILTAPARVEAAVGDLVAARLGDRATVAVFGSVARGQASASSDVDIALVLDDDLGADVRDALIDDLVALVEAQTGNAAQVVDITRSRLEAMVAQRDPLIDSWAAGSVTLAGPSLSDLIATR